MAELAKGQVYQDLSDGGIYRILYIDDGADIAYIISLSSGSSLPYMVDLEPLKVGIRKGTLVPTTSGTSAAPSISSLNARQQEQMARRWGLISAFVTDEPACFQEDLRSKFIQTLREETGFSDSSIRRILHRYWASGGTIWALAPRFDLRGRHKQH